MRHSDAMDIADRIAALDWARIATDLDAYGTAATGPLLTPEECGGLLAALLWAGGRLPQPDGHGPPRLRATASTRYYSTTAARR